MVMLSSSSLYILLLTAAAATIPFNSIAAVDALAFSPPKQLQIPSLFKRKTFSYTHLEGNGQLWKASHGPNEVTVVVDPIASQLDFGIPDFYRANKVALTEDATINLICDAQPSHCLLTMGLDDHTHLPTIRKLNDRLPNLQYVVAPSCERKLLEFGLSKDQITVLDHGESCKLGEGVKVTAMEGALVGPPWQKRENGVLLELCGSHSNQSESDGNNGEGLKDSSESFSIYYEPHADVVLDNIKSYRANIMVSPVTKQSLPAQVPPAGQYTLVYGGDQTLEIAKTLGVEVVVPLGNGALDIDGPLAGLVSAVGDVEDFETLASEWNAGRDDDGIRVARAAPGVPLTVSLIGWRLNRPQWIVTLVDIRSKHFFYTSLLGVKRARK